MLTLRANHTTGNHALTRNDYRFSDDAAGMFAAFGAGATAWRAALVGTGDALDTVGRGTYPTAAP